MEVEEMTQSEIKMEIAMRGHPHPDQITVSTFTTGAAILQAVTPQEEEGEAIILLQEEGISEILETIVKIKCRYLTEI